MTAVEPVAAPDAAWRGVAAESADDSTGGLTAFLRDRSRRLLASLLRPHRRVILMLGVVSVAQNLAAMAGPFLVKIGIDRGIPAIQRGDGSATLLAVVAVFFFAAAAESALTAVFVRTSAQVGQDVLLDLRTRLFAHFQALSISFHERYTSGRVISRLSSDVEALGDLLSTGVAQLVFALLSVFTTAVLMLLLDVPLALVALLSFPALLGLTLWFRRQAERAYRAGRVAVALVIVQFVESMAGIRVVQAFRREGRNQRIFGELNERYADANRWGMRLAAVFGPGTRAIGGVTLAVTLAVGAFRVMDGATTVGALAAILLYVRRFFEPMQDLVQFLNSFQSASAALEKLSGVLEEEPAVAEPTAPMPLPGGGLEVRLDGVGFSYAPGRPVLHAVDLVIPPGQTVAVVGETGAGKTTIARLLARFYDPSSGAVTLGGVGLRSVADSDLRRALCMVTQESFLFSGSVAGNIALGRPGASRPEIEAAAAAIGAHDLFRRLPDGYDSPVGKRGSRLSAGQRQLVAFARAFLADPRVLVLDEATSSLDVPSERVVQEALATLLADRTAVIIAHRLSTVEIADRVIVVHGGRIVEDGAPADLLGRDGRYRDLHRAWAESLA